MKKVGDLTVVSPLPFFKHRSAILQRDSDVCSVIPTFAAWIESPTFCVLFGVARYFSNIDHIGDTPSIPIFYIIPSLQILIFFVSFIFLRRVLNGPNNVAFQCSKFCRLKIYCFFFN